MNDVDPFAGIGDQPILPEGVQPGHLEGIDYDLETGVEESPGPAYAPAQPEVLDGTLEGTDDVEGADWQPSGDVAPEPEAATEEEEAALDAAFEASMAEDEAELHSITTTEVPADLPAPLPDTPASEVSKPGEKQVTYLFFAQGEEPMENGEPYFYIVHRVTAPNADKALQQAWKEAGYPEEMHVRQIPEGRWREVHVGGVQVKRMVRR